MQVEIEREEIIKMLNKLATLEEACSSGILREYEVASIDEVEKFSIKPFVRIIGDIQMNISKLNKAEVLAALYNNARSQGMGLLYYTPEPMTKEEAQELLDAGQTYFDYLKGRVMKIDLSGDTLQTALYNRDNGCEAAEYALMELL